MHIGCMHPELWPDLWLAHISFLVRCSHRKFARIGKKLTRKSFILFSIFFFFKKKHQIPPKQCSWYVEFHGISNFITREFGWFHYAAVHGFSHASILRTFHSDCVCVGIFFRTRITGILVQNESNWGIYFF